MLKYGALGRGIGILSAIGSQGAVVCKLDVSQDVWMGTDAKSITGGGGVMRHVAVGGLASLFGFQNGSELLDSACASHSFAV